MSSEKNKFINKLKNNLPPKYFEKNREETTDKIISFFNNRLNEIGVNKFDHEVTKKTLEDGKKVNELSVHISSHSLKTNEFVLITILYENRKLKSIRYIDLENAENEEKTQTAIYYNYTNNYMEIKKTYGTEFYLIKNNENDTFDVEIKSKNKSFSFNTKNRKEDIEMYCLLNDDLYIKEIELNIKEIIEITKKEIPIKIKAVYDKESKEIKFKIN